VLDDGRQQSLLILAIAILVVFTVLSVIGVVVLVGIRVVRRATSEHRQRNAATIRALLVAALVEEGDDAAEVDSQLVALRGSAGVRMEAAMLAMLPKVRGDAQDRLLAVLSARGADRRALAKISSRRAFVRCEGAFALGALRSADAVDPLIALLGDRSPLVRRVAVRSLGHIGDARAAESLVALADRDVGLNRDLVFALREIGMGGRAVLRAAVVAAQVRHRADDRTGPMAALVLGMIQDVGATASLAEAVQRGPLALKLAAAQALGNLDSPLGLAPLQAALRAPSNQVRVAAAASLGRLGAEVAIPALVDTVRIADPATARAAAGALVELGTPGLIALQESGLPYAIEALALSGLRSAV